MTQINRNTREVVEEDYRYDSVNALLDLYLKGSVTLEYIKEEYLSDFPEQRVPNE